MSQFKPTQNSMPSSFVIVDSDGGSETLEAGNGRTDVGDDLRDLISDLGKMMSKETEPENFETKDTQDSHVNEEANISGEDLLQSQEDSFEDAQENHSDIEDGLNANQAKPISINDSELRVPNENDAQYVQEENGVQVTDTAKPELSKRDKAVSSSIQRVLAMDTVSRLTVMFPENSETSNIYEEASIESRAAQKEDAVHVESKPEVQEHVTVEEHSNTVFIEHAVEEDCKPEVQEHYVEEDQSKVQVYVAAEEEPKPELQDHIAAEEESKPEVEDHIAAEEESKPEVQDHIAAEEESKPEVQDHIAVEEESKPEVQVHIAAEEESKPEVQDHIAAVEESKPEVQVHIAAVEESKPEVQDHIAAEEESKPEVQDHIAAEGESKPEMQPVLTPESLEIEQLVSDDNAKPDEIEEFIDILGNGQLLKKVLFKGQGQETRPKTDSQVVINYEARLGSGSIEGEVVDRHDGLKLTIGDCHLIQALDIALMLVELGERCQIVTGPQFAYGSKRPYTTPLGLKVPPDATITYVVELTSVEDPIDPDTLSLSERIALADSKRERGNFWFNREDYYTAVCCYARSAAVLEYQGSADMSGTPNASLQAALDARVHVYNNLAACQLKLEAWDSVVESCDKALNLQPTNAKTLFRKGRALASKADYPAALRVFRAALAEDPESRALQNEVARVSLECRRQQNASQDLYRRMMGVKSTPTRLEASSNPGSPSSSSASNVASSNFFGRYKYWLIGAVGSVLVSAILAGAAYRNSR